MKSKMAVLLIGLVFALVSSLALTQHKPLKDDDLHDPDNPALTLLQEPQEALGVLQPGGGGDLVDWVAALQTGQINPRANLQGDLQQEVLELDIQMTETFPLPYVKFPHKAHTQWMSCAMCHEDIFVSEIGANQINMGDVLEGRYCGVCHGAVSFPLTECNRCHSVKPENVRRMAPSGAVVERPPENRQN